MACNISNFGKTESGSSACNIAPRSTATIIDKRRLQSGFGHISEQRATADAAAGNQGLHLHYTGFTFTVVDYNIFAYILGKQFAHCKLVAKRSAGSCIANNTYSFVSQHLFHPSDAAFSAAGTHSEARGMFYFINRNKLAFAYSIYNFSKGDIIAMANIHFVAAGVFNRCHHNWPGVIFFQDKTSHIKQAFALNIECFNTGNISFIRFFKNFLNHSVAKNFALVINQVNFLLFFSEIFNRQKNPVFFRGITKNSKPRALVHTIHATYALFEINLRNGAGGSFCNSSVRTGKFAWIAGETIQAVDLNKRFSVEAFGCWMVRFLNYTVRVLLRIDIFLRNIQVLIVIYIFAHILKDLICNLVAAQYSAGSFADANGIARSVTVTAKNFVSLDNKLIIGNEPGADINNINITDYFLCPRYRFKVF